MIGDAIQCELGRSAAAPSKPRGFIARLMTFDANYRQRSRLAALTQAQLNDIGISRQEALDEARSPIWDPPIQLR